MKHSFKRALAIMLSVLLIMSNLGLTAFAGDFTSGPEDIVFSNEEEPLSSDGQTEDLLFPEADSGNIETPVEEGEPILPDDIDLGNTEGPAIEPEDAPEEIFEEAPAVPFNQSVEMDHAALVVTDDAGVFPEGETLQAEAVDSETAWAVAAESEAIQTVSVVFDAIPEAAVVTVYSVANGSLSEEAGSPEGETESVVSPEAIPAQEDGSFALLPGEYTYTAEAEGYVSLENVPFTVTGDEQLMRLSFEMDEVAVEAFAEKKLKEFDQSGIVNGVVVRVQAGPGVFPADAVLSVKQVPVYKQRQADAAVEEVRDENQNVAVSYTFDIKVIDPATGEEIQPAEGQTVNVSFALAKVADENLETRVYHVTEEETTGEMTAEALDVITEVTLETGEETTATVETDGFSIYQVEFTYNKLEYVLPGGASVSMSEILTTLGLSGEVTAVAVSDESLFSASDESGEWVVTAHRAFSTTEWMKVTINGVIYEITVTDDTTISNVTYIDADGSIKICDSATVLTGGEATELAAGWYVVNDANGITYTGPVTLKGNTHLILADNATMNIGTENAPVGVYEGIYGGIYGPDECALNIYGQSDATTENSNAGALNIYTDGHGLNAILADSITINGGNIITSASGSDGSGIKSPGTVTINGGRITTTATGTSDVLAAGVLAAKGVVFNGGQLTARGGSNPGVYISSEGDITLSWRNTTDFFETNSILLRESHTLSIAANKIFKNGTNYYYSANASEAATLINTDPSVNTKLSPAEAYSVTFNSNGGSAVETQIVEAGGTATKPVDPTKNDETFGGWYRDSELQTLYNFNATVTSPLTLYAKWATLSNSIADASVQKIYRYTGNTIAPVISNNVGTILSAGTDYTVNYGGDATEMKDAGTYTFTVKGAGSYFGEQTVTVRVLTFEEYDRTSGVLSTVTLPESVDTALIVSETTIAMTTGWYVVTDNVSVSDRISVTGDVNLVLCDGVTLTADKGISVTDGNSLTIYSQSGNTGTIIAKGWYERLSSSDTSDTRICAGIGGDRWNMSDTSKAGTITIHGGEINATGAYGSAGIGEAYGGSAGAITIYGGKVTATGGNATVGSGPGIGGSGATVHLGWCRETADFIEASGYSGDVTFEKNFVLNEDKTTTANTENSGGKKIVPADLSKIWTVSFDSNGGSAVEAQKIVNRSKVSEPGKPMKQGYRFVGWYATQNLSGIAYDFSASVTSSFTLYAKWEEVSEISYIGPDDQTVSGFKNYTPMENSYTTLPAGTYYVDSSTTVSNRIIVNDTVNLILGDGVTLTAAKGINVPDGATLGIFCQSGKTGTLTADADMFDAAIGADYGQSASGTVRIYGGVIMATGGSQAAGIGGGNAGSNGAVYIYDGTVTATGGIQSAAIGGGQNGNGGIISILGGKVTATSANSGCGIGWFNTSDDQTATITLSYKNYDDFILASSYAGTVTFEKTFALESSNQTVIATAENSGGQKIVPFTGITYTVTFDSKGGTTFTSQTIVAGQTATDPGKPIRSGYKFGGWFASENVSGSPYDFSTAVNSDLTLYAKWDAVPEISYIGADGETVIISEYIPLESDTTTLQEGTYSVYQDVTISNRIYCKGRVKLILGDGNTLTALNGIDTAGGASTNLYIFGQNCGTGTLKANAGEKQAAIGGNSIAYGQQSGPVYIYGGVISATGGSGAAAIGGGWGGSNSGVYIYGGTVNATAGENAPAIGGGYDGSGGNILILGGKVTVNGGVGYSTVVNSDRQIANITLGYKNAGDFIQANSYHGTVTVESGKIFQTDDSTPVEVSGTVGSLSTIDSKKLTPKKCTVTFVPGYDGGTALAGQSGLLCGIDKAARPTDPVRTGYTFKEWQSGGTAYDFSTLVTDDLTLTAAWTAHTYSVVFDKNGGAGNDMATQDFTYDEAAKALTANSYTRTGYDFAGWNNVATPTTENPGTAYTDGKSVQNLTAEENGIVTLYAQWTANSYTVRFNGNGSTSGSMEDQGFTYDEAAKALTDNAFARVFTVTYDYIDATGGNAESTATATASFNGWATSENGEKAYNNQQEVNNLTSTNGATFDLYAKWTDGSVTLPTPTRTGYTFGGWCSDSGLQTRVGESGASYTPSVDITLYAKWTPNDYTVKFNGNGATDGSMEDQRFIYDAAATALPTNTYTRKGYRFSGWNTQDGGGGTSYTDGQSVQNLTAESGATVTLFAQWTEKTAITPIVSITDWTYGDTAKAPSVTEGNSGSGAVTYEYKVRDAADSTYSATIPTNAGNYTVRATVAETTEYKSGTATADFIISPKPVGVSGITATNRNYNPNDLTVALSGGTVNDVLSGDTVTVDLTNATGTIESADAGENKSVTVSGVALSDTDAANYTLSAQPTGVTVTIDKIAYTGTKEASVTVRSGQITTDATLTLPVLPDGASYAPSGTVGGTTTDLISDTPTVSGTTLTYSTTSQVDSTSATITVAATGATNYNDYTVTITVMAKDKDAAGAAITGGNLTKNYGDAAFTLTGTVTNAGTNAGTNGVWTWESSDTGVATVTNGRMATPTITILKASAVPITLKASYESDTTIGEATVTLTVNPKTVTIPEAATSLKWTGNEQTGVASGDGYTVMNGTGTDVGDYTATATLVSMTNYKWSDDTTEAKTIPWSIGKADPVVTAPTAKNRLVYTGSAQELVTAGNAEGGTMKYAVTTENKEPAADAYNFDNTSIPSKTDAGTYYVWYKAEGDDYHADSEPAYVEVKIKSSYTPVTPSTPTYPKVTFKVVNGSWDDGKKADRTVSSDKLTAIQIPSVGNKPDDGYKAGSWDVVPDTVTVITNNTTYTYTYEKKQAATVTTEPTALDLTVNGTEQALITAGNAENGTMKYAVGITTPTDGWSISIPTATDPGMYYVWYKVEGNEGYESTEAKCIPVIIKYAPVTLVANGEEQELVKGGSVEGGTMVYALGTDDVTPPTGDWYETVLTGKDPGTYYVWYKVEGNENHNGIEPVCIKVTIVPDPQVQAFEEGVKTLPEEVTRNDEELVDALRKMYDDLSDDQKSQIPVEDIRKLEAAEKAIEVLKEEDRGKADVVSALIDQLPDPENAKPENKTAVDAVLKQYEALTDDQKALLPAAEKEKIEALKAAFTGPSEEDQAVVTQFTEAVSAVSGNKAGEGKALVDSMTEMLSSMTEEQKALIPESTMAAYQEAVDAFRPGRQFCSGDGYYKVLSNGDVTYHHPADETITSAVVPNQVKKGKFMFKVIKISNYAFDGFENLEWIVIHKNVRVIGEDAFNGTSALTKINIKGYGIVSGKVTDAFEGAGKNGRLTVKVPKKKVNEYRELFTGEGGLNGSVRAA